MIIFEGPTIEMPPDKTMHVLDPQKFVADNLGDVLIYNRPDKDDGVWLINGGGTKHAVVLNHGIFTGDAKKFFKQYPDHTLDFEGQIRDRDGVIEFVGKGPLRDLEKIAFWDCPAEGNVWLADDYYLEFSGKTAKNKMVHYLLKAPERMWFNLGVKNEAI